MFNGDRQCSMEIGSVQLYDLKRPFELTLSEYVHYKPERYISTEGCQKSSWTLMNSTSNMVVFKY